jgi:hypothetical protein
MHRAGHYPPELSDVTDFVNLLQRAGVLVNEVKPNPGLKGWFEDTEQAALIFRRLRLSWGLTTTPNECSLVICMNRSHSLNDWMFGFVNVVDAND